MMSVPSHAFTAALAVTNVAALTSWWVQWGGLISERGVTPAKTRIQHALARHSKPQEETAPTMHAISQARRWSQWIRSRFAAFSATPSLLCLFGATDRTIQAVFALGYLGCALLLLHVVPSMGAALCGLVYLSFVAVSQPWLGLQMDANLVETNVLFALLYPFSTAEPRAWILAQRWLVFRVMVACGAAKWSGGDPSWRDLTAMNYHYLTQPLPNPLSRFMHFMPEHMHRFEVIATYIMEGPLAFLYFAASPTLRWFAFLLTAGFNAAIGLSGNFGHLHLLTITEAIAVVLDLQPGLQWGQWRQGSAGGLLWDLALSVLAVAQVAVAWLLCGAYISVSSPHLLSTFHGIVEVKIRVPFYDTLAVWSTRLGAYRLCNYYSKFTHMTKRRWELQLQVTPDDGRTWLDCAYIAKPGGDAASLDNAPRHLPPGFIPRLDWRMWFLPLAAERWMRRGMTLENLPPEPWYDNLCRKICWNEPEVLRLLRLPPALAARPINGVRTLVFAYEYMPVTWADDIEGLWRFPFLVHVWAPGASQRLADQRAEHADSSAPVPGRGPAARKRALSAGKLRARHGAQRSLGQGAVVDEQFEVADAATGPSREANNATGNLNCRCEQRPCICYQEGSWWRRRFIGHWFTVRQAGTVNDPASESEWEW